jgi:hypothetical protein
MIIGAGGGGAGDICARAGLIRAIGSATIAAIFATRIYPLRITRISADLIIQYRIAKWYNFGPPTARFWFICDILVI